MHFSVPKIREEFPFFQKFGATIAYLDSAASSLKPQSVIKRMSDYYSFEHANVHRGVYSLSEKATQAFELARSKVATFLGGVDKDEVVFTSGVTDSLNLLAYTLGTRYLQKGDTVVVSILEHHSNIIPWQILAERIGIKVRFLPLTENRRVDLKTLSKWIEEKPKVISLAHVSNVLGTIQPIKEVVKLAQKVGALTVVDGAQACPHLTVDVKELGCDFYAFTGHKVYGPTGIGVLWGKRNLLEDLPPFKGGGEMIRSVTSEGYTCNELPYKFEAGTPPIAEAIGLGEAIDFMSSYSKEGAHKHIKHLSSLLYKELSRNSNIVLWTDSGEDTSGIVTFSHERIHPHDLAAVADAHQVCLRAGHHCAQPLMQHFKVPATLRLSPSIYNTENDLDKFFQALKKAESMF